MESELQRLLKLAQGVRSNAYAPYSDYAVGAAILGTNGKTYVGCNVENVSFSLTICAERSAAFAMAADGCRGIEAVAVATKDGGTPCGACLQVLFEFIVNSGEVQVLCAGESADPKVYRFSELLPFGFKSKALG